MSAKILVIEDEARMRRVLQLMLLENGFQVKTGQNGAEGIALWQKWRPDVVITDLKMPETDGMAVLDYKNRHRLAAPLIVLTAFGSIDSAVAAVKKGAFDYLTKPLRNERLAATVAKALAGARKRHPPDSSLAPRQVPFAQKPLIGSSEAIAKIHQAMARVAQTPTTVLITGESGVGKELVANGIHAMSKRSEGSFIKINCPAIPKDLIESELFGHRKGAFTGAVKSRSGAFQQADGGTLFLDEIGDLPLALQPKLLHAVEDKTVAPVGTVQNSRIDVRIIAATNQDLAAMVASHKFRGDLYFRLNAYEIQVPPLRNRCEDIPELAAYFSAHFAKTFKRPCPIISPEGLLRLKRYHWPGNVRELRNLIERCVLNLETDTPDPNGDPDITAEICRVILDQTPGHDADPLDLEANEKQMIKEAMEQTGWNQSRAARLLKISRNTLRYRLKRFGIHRNKV